MSKRPTSEHPLPAATSESADQVNEHLKRWERQLEGVKVPSLFPIPLEPRFAPSGEPAPHLVAYERRNGQGRLVEVDPSRATRRPLAQASRELRVEVLRRLPKIYEGLLIRLLHRTG